MKRKIKKKKKKAKEMLLMRQKIEGQRAAPSLMQTRPRGGIHMGHLK